jgi:cyclase
MKRKMFLGASTAIFENAKILRLNQTESEKKMWEYLKLKPLGYKFRRQHPLRTFVADFYCHQAQLIIEIDGDIHSDEEVAKSDIFRQDILESEGIKFLRFTNNEVEQKFEEIKSRIETWLSRVETNNTSV